MALELEEHGVVHLETGQDVEGRGGQEDFVALLAGGFVGVGGGIAVVLFFEFCGAGGCRQEVLHCFFRVCFVGVRMEHLAVGIKGPV